MNGRVNISTVRIGTHVWYLNAKGWAFQRLELFHNGLFLSKESAISTMENVWNSVMGRKEPFDPTEWRIEEYQVLEKFYVDGIPTVQACRVDSEAPNYNINNPLFGVLSTMWGWSDD